MYPYVKLTWNGGIESRLDPNDPYTIADITIEHKNGSHEDYDGEIEVMQYIGLKDRNGKEIFEGDILRVPWVDYPIGPVVFDDSMFGAMVGESIDNPRYFAPLTGEEMELLGNIYENPELLKS